MSKIPGDEEFARAKRRMRELDRNMDRVNRNVRAYFKEICPTNSHDSHILAEEKFRFRAYFFYKKDEDIQIYEEDGIAQKLRRFVYEELERQDRGSEGSITVVFEFDSDENVKANFEGDYFLRMR